MEPHQYPRRILVCVTGLSPQIVTETVYALAVETHGRPPFVPTEVHLISTVTGAEQARLALLAPDRDQFGRLCQDYSLVGIDFSDQRIEVIRDNSGHAIEDIRTPQDNEAAADTITRHIARVTGDDQAAVHVSIAGGRKSMGFFAGYALSLFGRPQDRLSHVLVSPPFESHRDFYYKPPVPVTLSGADGLEMSTDKASIHLAEIPFVPLRYGLHGPLLSRQCGYAETVRAWRQRTRDGDLRLDTRRARVSWNGEVLKLRPAQMAVLVWLACRRIDGVDDGWIGRREIAYERRVQLEFIDCVRKRFGEGSHACGVVEESFAHVGANDDKLGWIGPHISRINAAITREFGPLAAAQCGIESCGPRNSVRYRLALDPEFITIT